MAYRRTLVDRDDALFQTETGTRFTGNGLLAVYRGLTKRTGLKVTPQAMRRTFTILSLRVGMGELYPMALWGHTMLEMLNYYAGLEDDNLLQAHKEHLPIDQLKRDKLLS